MFPGSNTESSEWILQCVLKIEFVGRVLMKANKTKGIIYKTTEQNLSKRWMTQPWCSWREESSEARVPVKGWEADVPLGSERENEANVNGYWGKWWAGMEGHSESSVVWRSLVSLSFSLIRQKTISSFEQINKLTWLIHIIILKQSIKILSNSILIC